MTYETIRLETDDRGVARVTLARAAKHNAMNAQMIMELHAVCRVLDSDHAVRVVVLAADGPTFCAGGDLGWMRDQMGKDRAGKIAEAALIAEMLAAWNALSKPVVARIQAAAYGGGLGLIAVSDIAIADEDVKLALTETRLGLVPATIGPFVVNKLGQAFARQVFFSSIPFGAELGLRSGLLAQVCPPSGLDAAVEATVLGLLDCAPGAVADAKSLCQRLAGQDPADALELSVNALADRWETEETARGIAAFFARESPPWQAHKQEREA